MFNPKSLYMVEPDDYLFVDDNTSFSLNTYYQSSIWSAGGAIVGSYIVPGPIGGFIGGATGAVLSNMVCSEQKSINTIVGEASAGGIGGAIGSRFGTTGAGVGAGIAVGGVNQILKE